MIITVYELDTPWSKLGVVDVYESLIWTDRLDVAGDFELVLKPSIEMISLLQVDRCLSIPLSDKWMVIEKIQIDTDVELGSTMTVTGRSLESLLTRRVIWEYFSGGTKPGSGYYAAPHLFEDLADIAWIYSFKAPTVEEHREIINEIAFVYSSDSRIQAILKEGWWEPSDNLYDIFCNLATYAGVGWRFEFTKDTVPSGRMEAMFYLGQDRSYDQTTNPYVVFSPEFNNLLSSTYIYNRVPYKTHQLVTGVNGIEEILLAKISRFPDPQPTRWDVLEGWTDGSPVARYDENGTPYSDAAYVDALEEFGHSLWGHYNSINQFHGQAATSIVGTGVDHGTFKYRTDYFLGDIVQFENEYGLGGSSIVTEITINVSTAGFELFPTFVSVE